MLVLVLMNTTSRTLYFYEKLSGLSTAIIFRGWLASSMAMSFLPLAYFFDSDSLHRAAHIVVSGFLYRAAYIRRMAHGLHPLAVGLLVCLPD